MYFSCMKKQRSTVASVLRNVGSSARYKAFRNKMPVAVSQNGQTYLLFSDGRREPVTSKAIQSLSTHV